MRSPRSSFPCFSKRSIIFWASAYCSSDLMDARGNSITRSRYESATFAFRALVFVAISRALGSLVRRLALRFRRSREATALILPFVFVVFSVGHHFQYVHLVTSVENA